MPGENVTFVHYAALYSNRALLCSACKGTFWFEPLDQTRKEVITYPKFCPICGEQACPEKM
jgi:ribosomal protein L33